MAYKRIVGVYMIQSKCKPDRIYIGSGVNMKSRWNRHKCLLIKGKHHSLKLQRHYDKYGFDDLVYSIVEQFNFLSKEHLLDKENYHLRLYKYENTNKPYFNNLEFAGSALGNKFSPEVCKKMSEYRKGRKLGPNGGGWKLSEETRKKQSIHQIGVGNHNYGKKASKETRRKMSISRTGKISPKKGKKLPEEVRLKIVAWLTGRKQSKDTIKQRMDGGAKTKKNKMIFKIINGLLNNKVA